MSSQRIARPVESRAGSEPEAGVSLIECVCAIFILSTAILAAFSLYSVQERAHASQEVAAAGLAILKREYEWSRALPFAALADVPWSTVASDPRFEMNRVVVSERANLKSLSVSMRWTTPSGTTRVESLKSLRYRRADE